MWVGSRSASLPRKNQSWNEGEVTDMWVHVGVQVQPQTAPMDLEFEVVVVRGSEGPAPAILFPHGGPHSAYPASYMLGLAFLAGLGYTVLAVNFR